MIPHSVSTDPITALARMLADPLRVAYWKAFYDHTATPRRCSCKQPYEPGLIWCREFYAAFKMLPHGDQMTVLGTVS